MTAGPVQARFYAPRDNATLPTSSDPVALVAAAMSKFVVVTVPATGIAGVDWDPLTPVEMVDLQGSLRDIREGRYVEISESSTDDEVFRLLESD